MQSVWELEDRQGVDPESLIDWEGIATGCENGAFIFSII